MRRRSRRLTGQRKGRTILGLLMIAALTPPGSAATIRLSSTRLVLSPQKPIAPVTVHNDGAAPVLMQVQIVDWSQQGADEIYKPTRDILANPLQFMAPANGDQIIRLGLRIGPDKVERSYRVFIQEVPDNAPAVAGQVRTLLKLSVPIFVPPIDAAEGDKPATKGSPTDLGWKISADRSGQAVITLANHGRFHVQVETLTLSTEGGQSLLNERVGAAYVLPGQSRRWTFSQTRVAAGQTVRLSAATDQQDAPPPASSYVVDDAGDGP